MTDVRNRGAESAESNPPRRSSTPRDDRPLVEAIAAGDRSALAEAYSQHGGRVHSVARGVCGDTRGEDVTQEIFLQLWNNPQRYDTQRGSLGAYLVMQARSRAIDVLRADTSRINRENAENLFPRAPGPETDAAALAILERAEVDGLVAALPPTERDAILLAFFGGHTYREVARLLGVPEGIVKSRIGTGLKRLRPGRPDVIDLT